MIRMDLKKLKLPEQKHTNCTIITPTQVITVLQP